MTTDNLIITVSVHNTDKNVTTSLAYSMAMAEDYYAGKSKFFLEMLDTIIVKQQNDIETRKIQ